MNPKQFLRWGGVILLIAAALGFIGIIGPDADRSIFGEGWWFDRIENWTHLLLGVIALIASAVLNEAQQKPVVVLVGLLGVFFGIWSMAVDSVFLGANLENPADTILHFVIGVWALVTGLIKPTPMIK